MATYFCNNPISVSIPAEGATSVQITVQCNVNFGDGMQIELAKLKLFPDNSGNCVFRIDSILSSLLEQNRHLESISLETIWIPFEKTILRWSVLFKRLDENGAEIAPEDVFESGLVILGGRSWLQFPSSPIVSDPTLLHTRPSNLTVRRAPLFLTAFSTFGEATSLQFTFFGPNGETRIVSKAFPFAESTRVFNILLNEWPEAEESGTFTVGLLTGDTHILGPFTFSLDRAYAPIERTFIFRNSLGGIETLVTTGIGMEKLETDRMVANRVVGPGYSAGSGSQFIWKQESQLKMKVNSGWFPNQEQARWLAWELMLSSEVYELVGNQRLPVVVSTKSIETFQDENYLSAISFEYTYAFPIIAPPL